MKKLITYILLLTTLMSCNSFSNYEPVDAKKSPCYFYASNASKSETNIVYRLKPFNELKIGDGYKKLDADVASFVVLGEDYARDKNVVYHKYRKLDADCESFECLSRGFAKDKNNIYYDGKRIENADIDIASFTSDDRSTRDVNGVFANEASFNQESKYELTKIKNADPNSYVKLQKWWAKDDSHYFFGDEKIDVDVNSFKILSERIGVDKDSLYYFSKDNRTYKHSGTIRRITYNIYYDNNTIYNFRNGQSPTVPIKDPSSLHIADTTYSVVFFVDNILLWDMKPRNASRIDIASFKVLDDTFARDKYKCYYRGEEIQGADSETFVPIGEDYSKDKNHVYHETNISKDAP